MLDPCAVDPQVHAVEPVANFRQELGSKFSNAGVVVHDGSAQDLTRRVAEHRDLGGFDILQCGTPKRIAKLVHNSNFTMVYGTYNSTCWGLQIKV